MKFSKTKAIEQNVPLLAFIALYKTVLTLASDNKRNLKRPFKRKLLRNTFF